MPIMERMDFQGKHWRVRAKIQQHLIDDPNGIGSFSRRIDLDRAQTGKHEGNAIVIYCICPEILGFDTLDVDRSSPVEQIFRAEFSGVGNPINRL